MIRRAEVRDIPALMSLLEEVLQVHHEVRPDIFKAKGSKFTTEELEALIPNDQRPIFVYQDDRGRILGHLFAIVEEASGNALNPQKTLFIDDLCIDKSARGQKIGEKLYHFALEKAIEFGCYNVTLNVWNANEGAVRFYQRLGMKPQEMRMETILPTSQKGKD